MEMTQEHFWYHFNEFVHHFHNKKGTCHRPSAAKAHAAKEKAKLAHDKAL